MTDTQTENRLQRLNFRLWKLTEIGILQPPNDDFYSLAFTTIKPADPNQQDDLIQALQSDETPEVEKNRLLHSVLFELIDLSQGGVTTGNIVRCMFPNPSPTDKHRPQILIIGSFNIQTHEYWFKGIGVMEPDHVDLTAKLHKTLRAHEWNSINSGKFLMWQTSKGIICTRA